MRLIQIMAALGLAAALPAFAQQVASVPQDARQPESISWRCWYAPERGSSVACRLIEAPVAVEAMQLSARAPRYFARIRNEPASLEDEIVVIPLHGGPPTDMARVALLARAIMCGARAGCAVHFQQPQS